MAHEAVINRRIPPGSHPSARDGTADPPLFRPIVLESMAIRFH
jgi:hypothetical protein